MREIVTMHQPNYLPWIGLFSKVSQADCFVIMDNFQYTKDGVIHRNKIRTNTGTGYLTIPISKEFARAKIKDVLLPSDRTWQNIHWQSLYAHYIRSGFFKDYSGFFEDLYRQQYQYLWQVNMEIIRYLLKCFEINVEILMSSELGVDPDLKHTDMIIAVLQSLGANTYLSGPSGRDYLESEKFARNGLSCKFARFQHPVYTQRYPGFEPNLAAVDLLFNAGRPAGGIIKAAGSMEE